MSVTMLNKTINKNNTAKSEIYHFSSCLFLPVHMIKACKKYVKKIAEREP